MYLDYNLELLRQAFSDELTRESILAQHSEFFALIRSTLGATDSDAHRAKSIGPCPAFEDIVAMQVSVFDNGLKLKRGVSRYKLRWLAWTHPPGDFTKPDWTATTALKTTTIGPTVRDKRSDAVIEIDKLSRKSLRTPVTPSDLAEMHNFCAYASHGYICHQDGDGTVYLNGHFALADIAGDDVSNLALITPRFILKMPSPSRTTSNPLKPLAANVVAQSRFSTDENLLRNWATGADFEFTSRGN